MGGPRRPPGKKARERLGHHREVTSRGKIETVALMAATIYAAAGPAAIATTENVVMYGRVAAQAWALYDAVEAEAAKRHSQR